MKTYKNIHQTSYGRRFADPVIHSKGYTLLEIVMVIVIIAIISAIAVPNYLSGIPRRKLKNASRDLVSNMQLARINAIRDAKTWKIEFTTTGNPGYTMKDGNDNTYKTISLSDYDHVSYGSKHGERPGGTTPVKAVTYTANRVLFNANGTSKSGTVYFSNTKNDTIAVGTLSSTGRIKSWFNYGSVWNE